MGIRRLAPSSPLYHGDAHDDSDPFFIPDRGPILQPKRGSRKYAADFIKFGDFFFLFIKNFVVP